MPHSRRPTVTNYSTVESELRCKQMEEALQHHIKKTKDYLDLTEVILVELDDQGNIMMIGGKVYEFLGYRAGELLGKNWFYQCLPEEVRDEVSGVYLQLMQGNVEVVEYYENEILSSDGTRRCIAWHNKLVRDSDGLIRGTLSSGIDITDRVRATEALRNSEKKYRSLFENMTTGFALHEIILDEQGKPCDYRYLEVNPAFEKLTGVKASQLLGKTLLEVMPNTEKYWIDTFGRVALTGEPIAYENYSRELGRTYDTWVFSPAKNQFAVIFSDITERKRSEEDVTALVERLNLATEAAHIGIWDWDIVKDELKWDDRMFELYGVHKEDFSGAYEAWVSSVHPDDRRFADQSIHDALEHNQPYDIEIRVCWPDGSIRYIKADGQIIRDEIGKPLRMTGVNYDITDRVLAQEKLHYIAHHDALTELPNRMLLMDRLGRALTRAKRHNESIAVFFMDLDRFKNINDTFGHEIGDRFLKLIAKCLYREIRSSDTVARLGGDEFAMIVEDVRGVDEIVSVVEKFLEALARSFRIDGHEFYITASIGISLFPNDAMDAQTLLKNADTAMYRAKELGRNNYQFYSKDLSEKAMERLTLENDLRRALERNEFVLYYQPQIDLTNQNVVALEALLRWQHPEHGLILPGRFIDVAEETGLIVPIGNWVLDMACKQAADWAKTGKSPVPVTVNLSGRQFMESTLESSVTQTLDRYNLSPSFLELEITEGVMMHNPELATGILENLNEHGVRIAIDDFGTGYSSLSYLKRYPIKTLKIDKSFVRDIGSDANDASIVSAIIAMAHNMGLRVIAEGVESKEQLDFLNSRQCDCVQGHIFSQALSQQALTEYLSMCTV